MFLNRRARRSPIFNFLFVSASLVYETLDNPGDGCPQSLVRESYAQPIHNIHRFIHKNRTIVIQELSRFDNNCPQNPQTL